MSALRKIAVAIVSLFFGLAVLLLGAGTATADCSWQSPTPCLMSN
ncbi:hypothetical protein [Actinophytocola xinjiangensis]|nr:hypothetical protein [Actinophytocola xinjiangensis]